MSRTAFASSAAFLPGFDSSKTYAPQRIWRGSTTDEIKFAPLSKRAAVKIWHDARRFERQTMVVRVNAFGKRTAQGKLGRAGLAVLHALIFDFLNFNSGRLDPSYAAIAGRACYSIRSVARGLANLKAAGVLNWVRRCAGRMIGSDFVLEQETNAYGIAAPGQWRGYRARPPAPAPESGSWGEHPPMPGLGLERKDGGGIAGLAQLTAHGPGLAAAIGRFNARRDGSR